MTKSQRARVVELLRCAATGPLTVHSAGDKTNAPPDVIALADLARHETALELAKHGLHGDSDDFFNAACLIAAGRIEEKSWP